MAFFLSESSFMKKLCHAVLKLKLAVSIMIKCPELIPYILPAGIRKLFVPEIVLWP